MSALPIRRAAKHGLYAIIANDEQGYEWVLNRRFRRDDPLTVATLDRIRAVMVINTANWHRRAKGEW